jgi:glucoamylase
VNEVYYPRLDQANTRDCGLLVADGRQFFSEEKRHARHAIVPLAPGVPGYRLTNTCLHGRYRLEKVVVTDPQRDVLLQSVRFVPLQGPRTDYGVYTLLAPHIGNCGASNTGWVGAYKGHAYAVCRARWDHTGPGLLRAVSCHELWLCGCQ